MRARFSAMSASRSMSVPASETTHGSDPAKAAAAGSKSSRPDFQA
jgi:hypothetical protein